MNDDLQRAKQRLISALVRGTEDQFDTLRQIFQDENGVVKQETRDAMAVIIRDLKELLD